MVQNSTEAPSRIYSDFTRSHHHRGDFLKLLTRRLRKDHKRSNLFVAGSRYTLVDDGRLTTQVLYTLLEQTYGQQTTITLVKGCTQTQATVLCSDCLDEYIQKRLDVFCKAQPITLLEKSQPTPLRTITAQECNVVAQLFGLKGRPPHETKGFIDELARRYDQTKTSLLQSFLFLEEACDTRILSD